MSQKTTNQLAREAVDNFEAYFAPDNSKMAIK